MGISVKINYGQIKAKAQNAAIAKGTPVAEQRARTAFKRAKDKFLRDFDDHPVTQEINAGNRALNFSDTLGGYGNLFSFLGFYEGDTPARDLRRYLDASIQFGTTTRRGNVIYSRLQLPSMTDIKANTPMTWEEGGSWVEGIEKGVSNLSMYMYKRWDGENSRSKMGLQAPYEINDDLSFSPTNYLSEGLRDFKQFATKRF